MSSALPVSPPRARLGCVVAACNEGSKSLGSTHALSSWSLGRTSAPAPGAARSPKQIGHDGGVIHIRGQRRSTAHRSQRNAIEAQ
jgi:hypothetical protein